LVVRNVKVCGLTREEDVRTAVELGAWACGLVLTESPRRVPVARARRLAEAAAGTLVVGVFTTETPDYIIAVVAGVGLSAVQLSAGGDGPSVAEVRAAAVRRGLRPLVVAAADTADAVDADFLLLDARSPGNYGGTGRTLDWRTLAHALRDHPPARDGRIAPSGASVSSEVEVASAAMARVAAARDRLVLAGGLTAANVALGIAALRPFAVDVASGVERRPGVKDGRLMEAFFAAVRRAEAAEVPPDNDRTGSPPSTHSAAEVAP
jgi:phosphoribosylanthranilate isomerase